tara:strand:+ start:101161 stop:101280 length:120 start_codon:yes stop_codon:yes gene_type:complete
MKIQKALEFINKFYQSKSQYRLQKNAMFNQYKKTNYEKK